MNPNSIGMQAHAQAGIAAIRNHAMQLHGHLANICRRYRSWILGGAALFLVLMAGWILFAHRQSDAALSPDFRTSAQQAYEAISRCENYKADGRDSWAAREIDAELSLADAGNHAKTRADLRAAMALSNYLHEVKEVHLARQIRNGKSARQDYTQSARGFARQLRIAKQKAQTAIQS
jgi:hypothetical protein